MKGVLAFELWVANGGNEVILLKRIFKQAIFTLLLLSLKPITNLTFYSWHFTKKLMLNSGLLYMKSLVIQL